ncbi:hypothetical protein [Streptomyces sp. NPDC058092]|uniref:hypothetical protein n=1 Tax=Streptomyces sp. NPDC058092 TaxID=3346336 RepID=UPI0036DFE920
MLDDRVLHSRSPQGLDQEDYALLTTYQALIRAAADTACTRPGLAGTWTASASPSCRPPPPTLSPPRPESCPRRDPPSSSAPPAGPVLDALYPARRRHRVKARTHKNPTSKYGPNAGQHPSTSQNCTVHATVTFLEHGLTNRSRT